MRPAVSFVRSAKNKLRREEIKMKISAKSDKGLVRSENQDSFSTGELPNNAAWAVVCDGMGGAAGGRTASTTAVKIISEKISTGFNPRMSDLSVRNLLVSAVESANAIVFDKAQKDESLSGMGTTVVTVLINTDRLYVASAGDSRVYIASDELTQVTTDHSLVQEMVSRGEITKDEAVVHPKKNIITRALGVDNDIIVDFFQEEFNKEKDIVLLCTDGLTNYLSDNDILEITKKCSRYEIAGTLVNAANKNGGGDNVTVVALSD